MSVAIIDLDSICYSVAAPIRIEGQEPRAKTQQELLDTTDLLMHDILNSCNADSYVAFIKSYAGVPTFRYDLNPAYKANRDKVTPEWWPTVKKRLIEKWSAIPVADFEVDDYVNVTRLNTPDSFIVAIDKDLLDLEGTHYNWKKKEWITVEAFQAQYWFWRDMITGQPGDNIKGIPGKGKRFVEKLFDLRAPESYRSLVLEEYCKHFGEREGIAQYYINYGSLKIIDRVEDLCRLYDDENKPLLPFTLPTPIPYVRQVSELNENL